MFKLLYAAVIKELGSEYWMLFIQTPQTHQHKLTQTRALSRSQSFNIK